MITIKGIRSYRDFFEWIAYRDPEGFKGTGETEQDAIEDLIRQEEDWQDQMIERNKYKGGW